MPLTRIEAENFTVFEDITIPFSKGLNVLVGENGMGKTHIMKLAYAACQASRHDVSFSQKTTMLFRPDQSSICLLYTSTFDDIINVSKVTLTISIVKDLNSFTL